MPTDVKAKVTEKLRAVSARVPEFKLVKQHPELLLYTRGQIQDNINYIWAKDEEYRWKDCVEFNHRLDVTRKQCFEEVTPEFKKYV